MTTIQVARGSVSSPLEGRPSRPGADSGPGTWRLCLVWVLLLISLVSWRSRVFYSGGLDPTVAAKAVLTFIALVLAARHRPRVGPAWVLGPRSITIIGLYILCTVVGGWAGGSGVASLVLGVRVLMVAVTVALVMRSAGAEKAMRTAVVGMGIVGIGLAVSGIGTLTSTGRLGGGILPVSPNDLAMLFGPPVVWLLWQLCRGRSRPIYVAAMVVFLGLSWLTGSRTGMVALVVAMIIVLVLTPRVPPAAMTVSILAIPFVFYVLFFTGTVANFVGRNGQGNVATLNSRTIAWTAVFSSHPDFSHFWLGGGLTTKTVVVAGQFWTNQVVDSSWVSAYIQAGAIGLGLLTLWAVTSLIAAFRAPRQFRSLWVALVLLALVRSGLQSGLIDSATLFVAILLPALALDLRPNEVADSGADREGSGDDRLLATEEEVARRTA